MRIGILLVGGLSASTVLTAAAQTQQFDDPVVYCRVAVTADDPISDRRYRGGTIAPSWMVSAFYTPQQIAAQKAAGGEPGHYIVWRCLRGNVLACAESNNRSTCGKVNLSRTATPAMHDWCRRTPNENLPLSATGAETAYNWKCSGNIPTITNQAIELDDRGFPLAFWKHVKPADHQPTMEGTAVSSSALDQLQKQALADGKPVPPVGEKAIITHTYGVPWNRNGSKVHTGLDFAYEGGEKANKGMPVVAVFSGTIVERGRVSQSLPDDGDYIVVRNDDGTFSAYLHLELSLLSPQSRIEAGKVIGAIHKNHLHYNHCSTLDYCRRGAAVPANGPIDKNFPNDPRFDKGPWMDPRPLFPHAR